VRTFPPIFKMCFDKFKFFRTILYHIQEPLYPWQPTMGGVSSKRKRGSLRTADSIRAKTTVTETEYRLSQQVPSSVVAATKAHAAKSPIATAVSTAQIPETMSAPTASSPVSHVHPSLGMSSHKSGSKANRDKVEADSNITISNQTQPNIALTTVSPTSTGYISAAATSTKSIQESTIFNTVKVTQPGGASERGSMTPVVTAATTTNEDVR